mmetsp:Transcript_8497/g.12839  ORF Transcript_8497/g.12839 Transcript_8497/m.12839 type:complete len:251 (+) Transcript_8497:52-804(+)
MLHSFLLMTVASALAKISSAYGLSPPIGRREWISGAVITSGGATAAFANPASAAWIGGPPMVVAWPDVKYLVPIYELDGALTSLAKCLEPPRGAVGLLMASRLLNQFFKGGLLSNENVFRGLCAVYVGEITFDDPNRGRVRDFKASFLDDCETVIGSLRSMKKPLQKMVDSGAAGATPEVLGYLVSAQNGLTGFLARVPQSDLEQIITWEKAISAADVDRNKRLEEDEMRSLSEEDVKLYRGVGELLGFS